MGQELVLPLTIAPWKLTLLYNVAVYTDNIAVTHVKSRTRKIGNASEYYKWAY